MSTLETTGLVFGNGHSLPDASALEGFNFQQNLIHPDCSVAMLPGHPNVVVRVHDEVTSINPEEYGEIAGFMVDHLGRLTESGLTVPAQRFVVAKQLYLPIKKLSVSQSATMAGN